ncbi:MAG TPA: cytochrome b [Burkholderiaceae bacterium]|nr:cytochrome b [Burkholderiaceae bacterium]
MYLKNMSSRYGLVSRFFHWTIFALFAWQFASANVMTRIGRDSALLDMDQDFLYNWHKSIGLVLIVLALARIVWRRTTPLPQWSGALNDRERSLVHRIERWLYILMFAVPVSGYLFVMAGGYGVRFLGLYDLPDTIGRSATLAGWAHFAHVALTYAALVVISWHVGLGLKKHFVDRSRYLHRMLPFSRGE